MIDFLARLFDTSDFPARWHCGDWSEAHGWLHIGSDLATWGAYTAIPLVLAFFVTRRRRDIAFPRVAWLFVAFIFACGTVHLVEAGMFWWPAYRLSGVTKAATAVVSWATVFVLVPIVPKALAMRTPQELAALNEELEGRVRERTAELERQSRELARSNAELERFAYAASHDLKAPLRAMGNLATWIAEDLGDELPEGVARHVDLMLRRAGRMERMIADLLAFSRAGSTEDDVASVDTGALVREVVDMVGPPDGFAVEVDDAMPTMRTPAAPLEQVFANLVGNAFKHHDRPTGRIRVSAAQHDGVWEFSVQDDGPGVSEADQERVFGMFQTLQPRDRVEGSGLGLSLVQKVVEGRGGRVWLESEGRGTIVRFTWPEIS